MGQSDHIGKSRVTSSWFGSGRFEIKRANETGKDGEQAATYRYAR